MKYTMLFSTILALASPLALAGAKCDCSPKCKTECKAGNTKDCKCKHCKCATGGKCDSGCSSDAKAKVEEPATK